MTIPVKHILYFTYSDTCVSIYLISSDSYGLVDSISLPKTQLQESLVDKVALLLKKNHCCLQCIAAIYLNEVHSTWNANRLATLMVKTWTSLLKIDFLVGTIDHEKDSAWLNKLQIFKKVTNIIDYNPYYNTWTITNT